MAYDVSPPVTSTSRPTMKPLPRFPTIPPPSGAGNRDSSNASARSDPRLVVAIDYGTTNTGLAWMAITSRAPPRVDDIKVFKDWRKGQTTKVPSVISYSPTTTGSKQWGDDVADGSEIMRWTKLELRPLNRTGELSRLLDTVRALPLSSSLRNTNGDDDQQSLVPLHLGLGAVDIIADYLKKVVRRWYEFMERQGASGMWHNVPVDLVVTHPGVWSYTARNQTIQAVRRAFRKSLFPTLRDIALCTEPEACAVYTAMSAAAVDRARLHCGDCFIVCDAGGGTVDFISYQLVSKHPFKIEPLTAAASPECGASAIDRAFLAFLDGIVKIVPEKRGPAPARHGGGQGGHNVIKRTERMLLNRFTSIKHAFGGPDTSIGNIPLPSDCKVLETDLARSRVYSENLHLTHEDLTSMFEPSVKEILKYLGKQQGQIRSKQLDVTHIFLSGGFADSPYLTTRVTKWARMSNIEVEKGDESWGAVVKGAVLKGAGLGSTRAPAPIRFCPRSYGISVWKAAYENVATTRPYITSSRPILWLVRKGDYIPDGEPIETSHDVYCRLPLSAAEWADLQVQVDFVATAADKVPEKLSDVAKMDECIVLSAMYRDIPQDAGLYQHELIIKVELKVTGSGPNIRLTWGGKELAQKSTRL